MAKVIISDTSCLIVLSRIGRLHLLNELFSTITITQVVADEFGDPLPPWVEVVRLMSANGFRISKELWESLREIGNG